MPVLRFLSADVYSRCLLLLLLLLLLRCLLPAAYLFPEGVTNKCYRCGMATMPTLAHTYLVYNAYRYNTPRRTFWQSIKSATNLYEGMENMTEDNLMQVILGLTSLGSKEMQLRLLQLSAIMIRERCEYEAT